MLKTNIEDLIIEPQIFNDKRGCFFESYNKKEFVKNSITNRSVQDKMSKTILIAVASVFIDLNSI